MFVGNSNGQLLKRVREWYELKKVHFRELGWINLGGDRLGFIFPAEILYSRKLKSFIWRSTWTIRRRPQIQHSTQQKVFVDSQDNRRTDVEFDFLAAKKSFVLGHED
jgi:hypothetical protein